MTADTSSNFLQQVTFINQMPTWLINDNEWTRGDLLSLIGLIVGIIGAVAAVLSLWPYIRQRLTERAISKDFGVDLYLPVVIRDATRFYVRPEASSLDLSQEMEEPSNRVPTREDLFKAVERFLDDNSEHRHMLLLADSGMGKSAFVLNFYAYNKRQFARNRYRLAIVPLGHPKAINKIKEIESKRDTIIFLDAFDEDPAARGDYWARLKILMEECSEFKRVLLTCRTQFFPKDDAIPTTTGLVKVGPRNDEAHYEFWRLYISPLSDEQVEKYLRYRYHFWEFRKRRDAREIVHKVPLLTLRPMLLANIPEIIKAKVSVSFSWQLYELMVRTWYKREQGWWPDVKTIQTFSEEIAVKLHLNYLHQKADRIARSELSTFIRNLSVPIDEWNATTRSLLHRDADGNFKFAHRSIMEYLFIKRYIAGDKRCRNVAWTDQMQQFMVEILRTPRVAEDDLSVWLRFDLVGADLHGADLTGVNLSGKDLSGCNFNKAILRGANCHRTTIAEVNFVEANLTQTDFSNADVEPRNYKEKCSFVVRDFIDGLGLAKKLQAEQDRLSRHIHRRLPPETQQSLKKCAETNQISDPVLTTLAKDLNNLLTMSSLYYEIDRGSVTFSEETQRLLNQYTLDSDLRYFRLNRLLLEDAYPREIAKSQGKIIPTNFKSTNLSKANLNGANLSKTDFSGSNLSEANLRTTVLSKATLHKVNLIGADLRGARLNRTDFQGAKLSGAIFSNADLPVVIRDGTPILKTSLCGAILLGAEGLTFAQVSGAEIDDETMLPPDLEKRKGELLQRQLELKQGR
jgi:uncharacterized protein YjbI with pentapeptide repeats